MDILSDDPVTDRIRASLLAGAIGDALGAPVEFHTIGRIRARHGVHGLRDYVPAYGRRGAVTDDTQMTLFTAEGLLEALRAPDSAPGGAIDAAYRRWLRTQRTPFPGAGRESGLLAEAALWATRAPGHTCLSALANPGRGLGERADNNSKGCGGVMRVAPIGLCRRVGDPFALASAAARLTHNHPSGYLAAAAFALLVRRLLDGEALRDALAVTLDRLAGEPGHEETTAALLQARALAEAGGPATPERLMQLGGGWVAEEALAIALWCALVAPDLESALLLAINHDGDSDSTGSLTGNLLGAALGMAAIPARWLADLELRECIVRVADELAAT